MSQQKEQPGRSGQQAEANAFYGLPTEQLSSLPSCFHIHPRLFAPQAVEMPADATLHLPQTKYLLPWGLPDLSVVLRQAKLAGDFRPALASAAEKLCQYLSREAILSFQGPNCAPPPPRGSQCQLRIQLWLSEQEVYRVVRCDFGMSVREFVRTVLLPAMGWCVDYHTYVFIAPSEQHAACIMEENYMSKIDSMHVDRFSAYHGLVDSTVFLYDVFRRKGETAQLIYDLGDNWLHEVVLEEIHLPVGALHASERAEVLSGAGACPPEDSTGLRSRALGSRAYHEVRFSQAIDQHSAMHAANFMFYLEHMDVPHVFDPKRFLLSEANKRVQLFQPQRRASKSSESAHECAYCGAHASLNRCARCQSVFYCQRSCQVAAWPSHRRWCKKAANAPADSAASGTPAQHHSTLAK